MTSPKLFNKIICVFGRRGSGKSYLLKHTILPRLGGRILVFDPMHEYPGCRVSDMPTLFDTLETGERKIIFSSDRDDYFDLIAKLIYTTGCRDWFVVDEIDLFTSYQIGDMPEYLKKIVRYGRHKNIGLVCISRRPAAIPREITSQASYIISFKMHEPRDVKYLSEFMPGAEELSTLDQYHYICYSTDAGTGEKNNVSF